MSKRLTYLVDFFDAGKVIYAEGKTYPADENSERHVKAGFAAWEKSKPQTAAEKKAAEDKAAADAAAAQKLIDDAREAAIQAKALQLSQLNQVRFDALSEDVRNEHLAAAKKLFDDRDAAVLGKALELSKLDQTEFDALDEEVRNQHIEAAENLIEKVE